jgi:hypothetical protein
MPRSLLKRYFLEALRAGVEVAAPKSEAVFQVAMEKGSTRSSPGR